MADVTPPASAAVPELTDGKAFELLHPGVQRQLWKMGWTKLRPLQVQSIKQILTKSGDVILSAGTASGKTEAAFLPILSQLADDPLGSVRTLYVGPLKALINDQFGRVEDLCEHIDVPVHRWHGDVGMSKKAKLVEQPGGVLLITPESVESLFVNRSAFLRRLFGGLRFIVIDELHSFLDNERGLHLRSLLSRLHLLAEPATVTRLIGLSATIGDPKIAKRYLRPDRPQDVTVIGDDGAEQKETKYRIHAYRDAAVAGEDERDDADEEVEANSDDVLPIAADIVRQSAGAANLIFANRKSDVEEYADVCSRLGRDKQIKDQFLVHHGSLSAEIRQETETTMKGGAVATTFCSSTLEMGIDIGSVRMVGQIGPPWSVSSLKQRLGRSGRRDGEPRIMRVYVQCRQPDDRSNLFDRLHLNLVQAVAVTELMLEGWVEPPALPVCDLSTLTQQIISVIAQFGGVRADHLYRLLCVDGAFRDIEQALFVALLRCLVAQDVIEQMEGGDLILGLKGEKLRKDKGFYAVFETPVQYTVLHAGAVLGTIETAYEEGDYLLFAGRRWQIKHLNDEKRELHVVPARGWKRPLFGGGVGAIHPRIRQKMRVVLQEQKKYSYLDSMATSVLQDARDAASAAGLFEKAVISLGPQKTALLTWTGSRAQQTLLAAFARIATQPEDAVIALTFHLSEESLRKKLSQLSLREEEALVLAQMVSSKRARKYDWLLTDELLITGISRGLLDISAATAALRTIPA